MFRMDNKNHFEAQPIEIQKHIFSFFKPRELLQIQAVNKHFHYLSNFKELKEKYKDNIFYTVGTPIYFCDRYINFYKRNLISVVPRQISDKELINSLSKSADVAGNIKLFESEDKALAYARYCREIKSNSNASIAAYQPAVFKVMLLAEKTNKIVHEDIAAGMQNKIGTVLNFDNDRHYSQYHYILTRDSIPKQYHLENKDNVLILDGRLSVPNLDLQNPVLFKYKSYHHEDVIPANENTETKMQRP